MSFNPAAAINIKRLLPYLPESRKVIEFGNQRYTAKRIQEASDTRDFYLKNGFESYLAADINENMHATIIDLNQSIHPHKLGTLGQFNLVTNIGTGEHIFNQDTVMSNAHALCIKGGIIYHQLPFNWFNHGFYNFNPLLFYDLAAANGYEIIYINLSDRDGFGVNVAEEELRKEKHSILEQVGLQGKFVVNAALRKVNDNPFKMPFQGRYMEDIQDQNIKEQYA